MLKWNDFETSLRAWDATSDACTLLLIRLRHRSTRESAGDPCWDFGSVQQSAGAVAEPVSGEHRKAWSERAHMHQEDLLSWRQVRRRASYTVGTVMCERSRRERGRQCTWRSRQPWRCVALRPRTGHHDSAVRLVYIRNRRLARSPARSRAAAITAAA